MLIKNMRMLGACMRKRLGAKYADIGGSSLRKRLGACMRLLGASFITAESLSDSR